MPVALANAKIQKSANPYHALGTARLLWTSTDSELLFSGPAGTGKSRGCLEYMHWCASTFPGFRGLILRKTRASITQTAMVTFEKHVLPEGWLGSIVIWRTQEQEYRYPNGSVIVVGGMDNPVKVMSAEYDVIYIQEAIELREEDWEYASTRLRNGKMRRQRIIADTNPANPTHWLKQRCDRGATRMIYCRHEDNPRLYDGATRIWTREGRQYLTTLGKLTGVRYQRLRLGKWVSADGLVYNDYEPTVHLIDRFEPPEEWPRYWVVDFGYNNPFVWQEWVEDPDGALILYREIYRTRRLVEDHAAEIKRLTENTPRPRAFLCDHDAEDRATLTHHTGLQTQAAPKAVSVGIQAVQSRLRVGDNDKPRLYIMRDAVIERDPDLDARKLPASTLEEIDGYVWDTSGGRKSTEEPVKKDDHGMDSMRYLVAYIDKPDGLAISVIASSDVGLGRDNKAGAAALLKRLKKKEG
jgi:PBSX family phage terminase large subunit